MENTVDATAVTAGLSASLNKVKEGICDAIKGFQAKLSTGQFYVFAPDLPTYWDKVREDEAFNATSELDVFQINKWDDEHCDEVLGVTADGVVVDEAYADTVVKGLHELTADKLLTLLEYLCRYPVPVEVPADVVKFLPEEVAEALELLDYTDDDTNEYLNFPPFGAGY